MGNCNNCKDSNVTLFVNRPIFFDKDHANNLRRFLKEKLNYTDQQAESAIHVVKNVGACRIWAGPTREASKLTESLTRLGFIISAKQHKKF